MAGKALTGCLKRESAHHSACVMGFMCMWLKPADGTLNSVNSPWTYLECSAILPILTVAQYSPKSTHILRKKFPWENPLVHTRINQSLNTLSCHHCMSGSSRIMRQKTQYRGSIIKFLVSMNFTSGPFHGRTSPDFAWIEKLNRFPLDRWHFHRISGLIKCDLSETPLTWYKDSNIQYSINECSLLWSMEWRLFGWPEYPHTEVWIKKMGYEEVLNLLIAEHLSVKFDGQHGKIQSELMLLKKWPWTSQGENLREYLLYMILVDPSEKNLV